MEIDSETRLGLKNVLERFVNERLIPLEATVEEGDSIPSEIVEEMRRLGLFGLSIPKEFGGLGLKTVDDVLVNIILGQSEWVDTADYNSDGTINILDIVSIVNIILSEE